MDEHFLHQGGEEGREIEALLGCEKEKMDWERERMNNKLQLQRRIDLKKHEAYVK